MDDGLPHYVEEVVAVGVIAFCSRGRAVHIQREWEIAEAINERWQSRLEGRMTSASSPKTTSNKAPKTIPA